MTPDHSHPTTTQRIRTCWAGFQPFAVSFVRIVAAVTFIPSGTMKLFSWPVPMPGGQKLEIMSQVGIGGILETFGGILLLLGLWTRPVAFLLSGTMAVAYWQFHAPGPNWMFPSVNQGTAAVMFCLVWLLVSTTGAGPVSLDALFDKGRTNPNPPESA